MANARGRGLPPCESLRCLPDIRWSLSRFATIELVATIVAVFSTDLATRQLRSLSRIIPAVRSTSAARVRVGFAVAVVGKTPDPTKKRFG
jgi:hypothetical protein